MLTFFAVFEEKLRLASTIIILIPDILVTNFRSQAQAAASRGCLNSGPVFRSNLNIGHRGSGFWIVVYFWSDF